MAKLTSTIVNAGYDNVKQRDDDSKGYKADLIQS
jgi:hypothetical protein